VALELFAASIWRVGGDSDRMGMRLSGPRLAHGPAGANIVSDGATPGAIQVPGDGQPIVLRADCQTSGGYAKIGCIISADIGRLAHFAPGEKMGFAPVDHEQAAQARTDLRERFARWRAAVATAGEEWDSGKLWSENLISGAILGD
jgi:allophanate hydrolase